MSHVFEIYRDRAGEYRVRFKYNSEVIWSSEGYASKVSAQNLIDSLKRNGPDAPIEDLDSDQRDLIQRLRRTEVPASDRTVRFDHNSQKFNDFEVAYRELVAAIKAANDFGGQTDDQVEAIKAELDLLSQMKNQFVVRTSQIWQFAKNTLLWIAEQALGAIIGSLALAALAALASLLGITF